ncbi:MAG: hypothetical protein II410_06025 [Ruminococcus sp.]|nr:hypothetical protein [Ruminococcus sp.]
MNYKITEQMIPVIESILRQDKRVELIPTKVGIKIICVERHEAKKLDMRPRP